MCDTIVGMAIVSIHSRHCQHGRVWLPTPSESNHADFAANIYMTVSVYQAKREKEKDMSYIVQNQDLIGRLH